MCVQYIGGIPWVHRGDIMSTSEDIIMYVGGIPWVHRGDIMSTSGGYHDACGGYHEYIGRCSVHRGLPWVRRGVIMSTSGGCHEYIGVFNRNWKVFTNLLPHMYHDIPPMYSWYPPDVLMVSPQCTEHLPMYSWYPPMYSWYPPDVLNTHYIGC